MPPSTPSTKKQIPSSTTTAEYTLLTLFVLFLIILMLGLLFRTAPKSPVATLILNTSMGILVKPTLDGDISKIFINLGIVLATFSALSIWAFRSRAGSTSRHISTIGLITLASVVLIPILVMLMFFIALAGLAGP